MGASKANKVRQLLGMGTLASAEYRGKPGAGIDKGTVTRVISEGWLSCVDHAAIEARVPRSRIHLPPGSSMGRGTHTEVQYHL